MLTKYLQKLPHFQSVNSNYFVTYRLFGSIPAPILYNLQKLNSAAFDELSLFEKETHEKYFAEYDSILDNPLNGPYWLEKSSVAQEVYKSLIHLDAKRIDLSCFTIMS